MQERERRQIVQTDPVNQAPSTRPLPIAAQSVPTGTATAMWTVPADGMAVLSGLVLSNGNASARTVTLHAGASASGAALIENATVAANGVLDISNLLAVMAGESLWAVASGNDVKVSGWATVYL